jgi:peptide/nickel transport system permease protein
VVTLPVLVRHVRSAMIDVLESPFIRAARGHGISRGRLLFHYALPAASNPLVSLLGFSVATMLSASMLAEVILSWPGLGPLLVESILSRDVYVVVAVVMLSSVFLVMGNLLADLLLFASDPRIRTE